ncbi:hypothetical protein V5O48_002730 [Marasmius crinis-equi]|uniref:Uncharacterized protein n=1 Tax=Marasmius crinis-equi TaxID=585013 RepID=A0ABR3FVB2_9AGAR
MDVDYCLTCQCHFESGPFNPYCSLECRPASSHQHRQLYECVDSYSDEDEFEEPIYHYVQDTSSSYIRQWAANVPSGAPPTRPSPITTTTTRHRSPSRPRPKLLTSLSRPPASTTSQSFHNAESPSSSESSIATPTDAPSPSLMKYVKGWVSPKHPHKQFHPPPSSSSPPASEADDEPQVWWIPESSRASYTSQAMPISTQKRRSEHDRYGDYQPQSSLRGRW